MWKKKGNVAEHSQCIACTTLWKCIPHFKFPDPFRRQGKKQFRCGWSEEDKDPCMFLYNVSFQTLCKYPRFGNPGTTWHHHCLSGQPADNLMQHLAPSCCKLKGLPLVENKEQHLLIQEKPPFVQKKKLWDVHSVPSSNRDFFLSLKRSFYIPLPHVPSH